MPTLRSWGYALAAVGAATTIPIWLGFGATDYAVSTVVLCAGLVLAAFARERMGLGLAAAGAAHWVVGFTLDGFDALDILGALLWAAGFGLAAAMTRPRSAAFALLLVHAGNAYYLWHNAFSDGTREFVLGNVLLLAGLALAVVNLLGTPEGSDRPR